MNAAIVTLYLQRVVNVIQVEIVRVQRGQIVQCGSSNIPSGPDLLEQVKM